MCPPLRSCCAAGKACPSKSFSCGRLARPKVEAWLSHLVQRRRERDPRPYSDHARAAD
jgi:hypothetical protein